MKLLQEEVEKVEKALESTHCLTVSALEPLAKSHILKASMGIYFVFYLAVVHEKFKVQLRLDHDENTPRTAPIFGNPLGRRARFPKIWCDSNDLHPSLSFQCKIWGRKNSMIFVVLCFFGYCLCFLTWTWVLMTKWSGCRIAVMAACNVVDHAISLATRHGTICFPDALAYVNIWNHNLLFYIYISRLVCTTCWFVHVYTVIHIYHAMYV